ncbi:MAG: hypothetical protein U0168_25630 [Nannocystaceae bacterium]
MSDVLTLQLPPPPSQRGGYAVRVGAGVAQGLGACVRQAAPDARAVGVVSDDNVWSLYGAARARRSSTRACGCCRRWSRRARAASPSRSCSAAWTAGPPPA